MSRLEKTKIKKYSKKKYKTICIYIFMFVLIIITLSSTFLIDYRINQVLDDGKENVLMKYIEIF